MIATDSHAAQSAIALMPHQTEGRDFLLEKPRAILGDDMGLGKTYQALAAAQLVGLPVVVIGPPKLKRDWLASAEKIALGLPITYLSFTKIPEDFKEPTTLIVEEAHWAQGGSTTARGRKILQLARSPRTARIWLLSGTPMRNSLPINLLPLVEMCGLIPDKRAYWNFLNTFCGPKTEVFGGKPVTTYKGATNLSDLSKFIEPVYLARKKAEILDLPEKIYCDRRVPLADRSGLVAALNQAQRDWERRGTVEDPEVAALLEAGIDTETALEQMKGRRLDDSTLQMLILSRMKALSELDKVDYAAELAEDFQEDDRTLYFCCYRNTAKALSDRLGAPLIDGETSGTKRQELIDGFQAGKIQNLILTIRAAGVGITLTLANNEVFVGREWAPEDNLQAEDRAYRIGQKRTLTVFRLDSEFDWHLRQLHAKKNMDGQTFQKELSALKRIKN